MFTEQRAAKLRKAPYSLRPATSADYDFLYQLHVAAMREYVEALWGWEEAWQQEYFARKFDPDKYQIIQIDGRDAGVLVVEDQGKELYLGLIELLPAFQRRGVGTSIIADLIRHARESGQTLSLHVLKSNEPARRLYERLGFAAAGEEEYKVKMIRQEKQQSRRSDP